MDDFYDQLTPYYHLLYQDWDAGVQRQAEDLDKIIASRWDQQIQTVLDVTCGVGTQAIGLAQKGYAVTASDLSAKAVERAQAEAHARNLDICFSVCDVRQAYQHHRAQFDLVISCDNSLPHLLNDQEILAALEQMYACTSPDGGCLVSIRNYDEIERGTGIVKLYGIREEGNRRYLIFQVWDFEDDQYDLSLFIVEDDPNSELPRAHVMRSRYYAIRPDHLLSLMRRAGFEALERLDDVYFQPVLVGTRKV